MDSGEYDERDYGMVIDVFQLLPADYVQYIDADVCSIHYFVTSDVTPEERYELLKRYDTPRDYTFYQSDEEKRRDSKELVELSRYIKEQCVRYQLPYYETAHNREQVTSNLLEQLEGGSENSPSA